VITATGVELRAGARVLIESASFRIARGDRIGLVGRNGAGKTTLTKCLAGEGIPAGGTITRGGETGYLPQDPRTGDLDVLARDRVLSARGLDTVLRGMRENEQRMATGKACPTGCSASRCTPSPAASGAASSWPASSSRTPTPCCSTSPPTTWTPTPSGGCGTS
jgi:ATPase subunit of ABC transporter with duplicated ATPase domains